MLTDDEQVLLHCHSLTYSNNQKVDISCFVQDLTLDLPLLVPKFKALQATAEVTFGTVQLPFEADVIRYVTFQDSQFMPALPYKLSVFFLFWTSACI